MKSNSLIKKIPFGVILVILLSLAPLTYLFHAGLPITHDGVDHVARIANFYKGLSEGVIFPRWAENLNWGYGHPILMFLYPLSSYIASLFHWIGFSYIDSVKLVFGVGYVASGITMYLWVREEFGKYAGVAASMLYLYAPYRFVDLYVRGAIGEHMAFIFPPLVLFFINKYFNTSSKSHLYAVGIAISVALLLLAHNAISLMFLPLICCYAIFLSVKKKNSSKLLIVFSLFIWGFLLSAFFTVPAFLEGKFTLRDIVTGNEYKDRFVQPLGLLFGKWSYGITGQFSVQIGIGGIIGTILSLFIFLKIKQKNLRLLLLLFYLFLVFSIFIMLPQSNFVYEQITTLKKFQFPWRFLSLTIFTTAFLSSSVFLILKKDVHKKVVIVVLSAFLIASTFTYWNPKGYLIKPDAFFNGIYNGTTDTGESSPIWSTRFMEHTPNSHLEAIGGQAIIKEGARTTIKHVYTVNVLTGQARMRENTLYFPNWEVLVNGSRTDIQFQDPNNRGLITFQLPHGISKIEVVFYDTKLRILSNILTLLSAILIPIIVILGIKKYEK